MVSVLLATICALSLEVQAQSSQSALGATGTVWGGEHVKLEITPEGPTLVFDCATGTIAKPLRVDAQGDFKTTGTFTRERPGPVMRDGNPAVVATYSGSVQNGTMKLTITSSAGGENFGDYVLVQGKPGHVVKCR